MARRRNRRGSTLRPPPGLYDPALDAAQGASQRGLGDYQDDYRRDFGEGYGGGRAGHDYQLGLEDLALGHTRAAQDFGLARGQARQGLARGREDYARSVGLLRRDYRRLGRRQGEAARHAGVLSGGLAARAAAIRDANQAVDRRPLDTGIQRLGVDTTARLNAIDLASTREGQDYDTSRGRLGLGYQRQLEDAGTGLTRAEREADQFGRDTLASETFQATQAGWNPPDPEAGFAAHQQAAVGAVGQAYAQARRRYRRGRRGSLVGTAGRPTYGANF